MISFIIIGRNEGIKLVKCINSIYAATKAIDMSEFDITYVDSQSNDNSVELVSQFKEVNIFKIIGQCNPAIGRNIGARESKGDILFFLDGDMELISDFLPKVIDSGKLVYEFLSGDYENYFYSKNGELLNHVKAYNSKNLRIEKTTGGLFLITRELWDNIGGMRAEFRYGEDMDLGLRLAKNNIFLHRYPYLAAKHHTISYMDSSRKWPMLFGSAQLYTKSYLYRRNFFNIWIYPLILRKDYTFVFLIFSLIILIYSSKLWFFLLIYFILIFVRSLKVNKFSVWKSFPDIFYYSFRDTSQIIGLFTFFPPRFKKPDYIKIV